MSFPKNLVRMNGHLTFHGWETRKYVITYDDLLDHTAVIDEFTDLDKAREAFKAECYTPADVYDDLIILEARDRNDGYIYTIDDYQFTRLDRDE